jgi:hypothetical protein
MAVWNVIDHDEFTGTSTNWEKTSIGTSYDHLYIMTSQRVDASVIEQSTDMTFNSSGSGYSYTYMEARTSSPYSTRGSSQARIIGPYSTGASVLADTFASSTIWIPNYANTSNYKQVIITMTLPNNSASNYEWRTMQTAGLWSSASAIDSIKIETSGGNFVQYSTFTLYGINGAA